MSVSMNTCNCMNTFQSFEKPVTQSILQTKEIIGLCLETRKARTLSLECQCNGKPGIINGQMNCTKAG